MQAMNYSLIYFFEFLPDFLFLDFVHGRIFLVRNKRSRLTQHERSTRTGLRGAGVVPRAVELGLERLCRRIHRKHTGTIAQ